MKLATAVKTLHKQAGWLGISHAELLADIARHGRILYPELVIEAAAVYRLYQELEAPVASLEKENS